jgi:hypothetical protein
VLVFLISIQSKGVADSVSKKPSKDLENHELHIAVKTDDIDSVAHLLRGGVDPNIANLVNYLFRQQHCTTHTTHHTMSYTLYTMHILYTTLCHTILHTLYMSTKNTHHSLYSCILHCTSHTQTHTHTHTRHIIRTSPHHIILACTLICIIHMFSKISS